MTALQPSTDETSQAPASEPSNENPSGVRADLLSYAELGGFTLTAKTHAWYAAVDTVATPEEARAASTVLAELRGRDLPATRETAARLVAETTLGELNTAAAVSEAVALLLRVRATLATVTPAAFAALDLDELTAATASGRWRKEHGVTLSWSRRRALRREARALATSPAVRRGALHEALAAIPAECTEWSALSPNGARPALPADATVLDNAAQAIEAARTGLRELDRLLPEYDLTAMPFPELADLVDELAADEGTLYRLPTLRALRDGIEQQGHGELLAELAEQHADSEAVAAACDRTLGTTRSDDLQTLLPGPREDGDARDTTPLEAVTAAATAVAPPTPTVETEVQAETPPTTPTEANAEAKPAPEAEVQAEAAAEANAEAAPEAEAEIEAKIEAEAPKATPDAEAEADQDAEAAPEAEATTTEIEATPEPAAEVDAEAEAAKTTSEAAAEADEDTATAPKVQEAAAPEAETAETAPEAEAEAETVAAEAAPEAEVAADPQPATEAQAEEEAAAEAESEADAAAATEPAADVEPEAESDADADVEALAVVEPEADAVVEPEAEPETVAVTDEAVTEDAPQAETPAEAVAEGEAPAAEIEPVAATEAEAATEADPAAEAEPVHATATDAEAEPATDAEPVAEAKPVAEAEPVAEPVPATDAAPAPEPAPAAEASPAPAAAPAPAAGVPAARSAKPAVTPGRPVSAYSAAELLSVVHWIDGDGVDRTDDELLRAAMKELGFSRLGPRIKESLGAAVAEARS
ncbi:hypothetical protein GXW83_06655 [Streptacidiphilus sp. PB12-B1b]|uniref:hypothetical protein n=1 Tax=Streptacidiphilus sp. PB12-B1b TaxID=2705012 RepID=UPI0015FA53D9|nr:hypothetical protein [Streptacidiphilus sp. PB12-B1b]QMU75471.1 hypothetical protein GXW83_06655 [Streptacidiphilus sp. PB12-B1b]